MPGEIQLLVRKLSGPPSPEALATLTAGERARAARFRFELHRHRYINRHYWWRRQLARCLQCAVSDLDFEPGAHGKPQLRAKGRVPGYFNGSSSQDYALLGFDPTKDIGVDIECVRPFKDAAAFAARHFAAAERASIRAAGRSETLSRELFYRVWTRKEAFLKCTGPGLVDDLEQLHVGTRNSMRPFGYREASGVEHVCYLWTWLLQDPLRAISVASPQPLPGNLHPETVPE